MSAEKLHKSAFTLRLIAVEKFLRGALLFIIGVKLLTLIGNDVHQRAAEFVQRHGINMGHQWVQSGLDKLRGVNDQQLEEFGIVAALYSLLMMVEGTGLWLGYRWAEYVTIISTSLLMPLETYEMIEKFTFVRLGLLFVNIAIVGYLVWRVRSDREEAKTA
ncbi:MAG: DUF2127 domain-containing protein [Acidobacteria bacterium]|nr:DUF2127 domain-containing protein [Acidobacteriota bacterium]